ncbi:MAG: neutral/alkaline non-lysosomal ceramidase N-terminal domain-containing protein [Candidatus Cyclobacteriaceae bacterium M3_2C_046]
MIKKIFKFTLFFLLGLVLLLVFVVGFINQDPVTDQSYYQNMMQKLDTMDLESHAGDTIRVGWSRINITPPRPTPMAGYKPRPAFTEVTDSLYIRTLVIANGNATVAFVSADLLIFPPMVNNLIRQKIKSAYPEVFIYLGATHTHYSLGGWDNTIVGNFSMGRYDQQLTHQLARQVMESLDQALQKMAPAALAYFQIPADQYIRNRLNPDGAIDGFLRGIEIVFEQDHEKAYLVTYSAHATNLPMKSTALSNDYPGQLIRQLESAPGNQFALFMAGMVGSHNLSGIEARHYEKVQLAGKKLSQLILQDSSRQKLQAPLKITSRHIPLEYPEPQLRLTGNFRLRSWLYELVLGELSGEITLVKLNQVILIGVPVDFSGELYADQLRQLSEQTGMHVIITGFNGDYVGYVIDSESYFNTQKEEGNVMNWLGPQSAQYFSQIITRLVQKLDRPE